MCRNPVRTSIFRTYRRYWPFAEEAAAAAFLKFNKGYVTLSSQ